MARNDRINAWLNNERRRQRRRSADVVPADPWTIDEWVAGTNTTLSIAAGRARATRNGGNPRISREVSGLTEGVTYRVETNGYAGTAGSAFFRVSADADLTNGDYVNSGGVGVINQTFVAPAGGVVYVGIVGVTDADGQYVETDENFTFSEVA